MSPLSETQPRVSPRRALAGTTPAVLLACVVLAGCGGSTGARSVTAARAAGNPPGGAGGRFAALRSCLSKQGITLPNAPAGGGPPPGPGGGGTGGPPRGFQLPKGVGAAQFRAALAKCGGGTLPGRGGANSASFRAALAKFTTCMTQNGVKLPAPNTSGNGPVFNTKGLNTNSTAFQSAQSKCSTYLQGTALGSGAGGAAPPGAGPGAAAPESEAPAG